MHSQAIPSAAGPPWTARKASLALIALMVALAGWHAWIAWRQDDRTAEQRVTQLTSTLKFQTDTTFRAIDSLLTEAAQRIDPDTWPEPELVRWFQSRLVGFPEARNFIVARADGSSAGPGLSADGLVGQPIDVSDRQHFRLHKAGGDPGRMIIGDPITDRLDGRQIIPVSRALTDAQGRFRGMVGVGIDPNYMVRALESLLIEEAGGISVIRKDGIMLARLPDQYGSFGRSVAKSDLFTKFLSKSQSGIGRFVSVSDGNAKIVGFSTLERYPLVATVGITEHTAYAQWRAEVLVSALVVVLFSAALFWLAALSDQRAHSMAQLARRLEDQGQALERQVAERTAHLEVLQAEAEERARQLAASNSDLEQFAYVASHDLQEPLRTVSSFLQLLQHRYEGRLDAEADEFIGFAVDGAHRMHHLIQDLLAYSRVTSKGSAFAEVDLDQALAEAKANLETTIQETGAVIEAGTLPKVMADQHQMVSLFQNLLANAIKYRKPDQPPLIRIQAAKDGERWTIKVEDNGIGIDPADGERIFVIFQRLHSAAEYEGTGIGLALCKRIVERHGGHIWLDSQAAKGATFCFTLTAVS